MTFASESQKLDQQAIITLVTITHIDAGTYRFASGGVDPNDTIAYSGNTYFPRQINISGLAAQGGKLPRPKLALDNTDDFWYPLVVTYSDLRGATVNITEIYREGLDDGATPSPNMIVSDYTFDIRQKSKIDPSAVNFILSASMDRENAKFGRQCLRHVCPRAYRVANPNTSGVFYAQPDCPYTGVNYFKKDGTVTAVWTEDDCGGKLSDCILRFGTTANLPFQGVPSIGQQQT